MVYLGFADGLFGLHCLRFNLGLFMVVFGISLCLRLCYTVPIYGCSADLWLVWRLLDCALMLIYFCHSKA